MLSLIELFATLKNSTRNQTVKNAIGFCRFRRDYSTPLPKVIELAACDLLPLERHRPLKLASENLAFKELDYIVGEDATKSFQIS